MEAQCQSPTMSRTLWRFSTTTAWPSAGGPCSSWSMTSKHPAASWGTAHAQYEKADKISAFWPNSNVSNTFVNNWALWVEVGLKPLWRYQLDKTCPLPGGSLLAMEQTSDSECTDTPNRAAERKCLTCSRFCPASATTPTWSLKTAASPASSLESVSSKH